VFFFRAFLFTVRNPHRADRQTDGQTDGRTEGHCTTRNAAYWDGRISEVLEVCFAAGLAVTVCVGMCVLQKLSAEMAKAKKAEGESAAAAGAQGRLIIIIIIIIHVLIIDFYSVVRS